MIIHKPIQITNLELSFLHKPCFQDFSVQINYGVRIAIIGRNGCGKSTLLKILLGTFKATSGYINVPEDAVFGYVPQIIYEFYNLSGGQRFNQAMTNALSLDPNVLLLDEPTNHLDSRNRKILMRMLSHYLGTLIIVSHDTELLRNCVDTLWHVDNGKIHIFSGNYDDYMREIRKTRSSIERELLLLEHQKKDTHQELMKEQNRAAKSKVKGEKSIHQRKWPSIVSKAKASRAEVTSGNKKSAIDHKKQKLTEQLSNMALPEIILPYLP
jgi:ATPase subunit of ABC transporter with duplicated ATPase domains